MRVVRPATLEQALALMADAPGALTPIAGGTDLLVSWGEREHGGMRLLDLSRIEGLRPVRVTDGVLEIGALTTYWDVLTSPALCREFPLLEQAARVVGSVQVQTRGTWAGNVANGSPAADGVLALMAYDAAVVLRSAREGEEVIPLERFYTGYRRTVRRGEQLIVAIRVPRRARKHELFFKVGARAAQAISKVGVAMALDEGAARPGWRVAAGSVGPTVRRLGAMEAALDEGRAFASAEEMVPVLRRDIAPIDDLRSTARYRETVLARVIYYRLQELAPVLA